MLAELARARPAAIVLWRRPVSEYDRGLFGEDYGQEIRKWIDENYRLEPFRAAGGARERRRGSSSGFGDERHRAPAPRRGARRATVRLRPRPEPGRAGEGGRAAAGRARAAAARPGRGRRQRSGRLRAAARHRARVRRSGSAAARGPAPALVCGACGRRGRGAAAFRGRRFRSGPLRRRVPPCGRRDAARRSSRSSRA